MAFKVRQNEELKVRGGKAISKCALNGKYAQQCLAIQVLSFDVICCLDSHKLTLF